MLNFQSSTYYRLSWKIYKTINKTNKQSLEDRVSKEKPATAVLVKTTAATIGSSGVVWQRPGFLFLSFLDVRNLTLCSEFLYYLKFSAITSRSKYVIDHDKTLIHLPSVATFSCKPSINFPGGCSPQECGGERRQIFAVGCAGHCGINLVQHFCFAHSSAWRGDH